MWQSFNGMWCVVCTVDRVRYAHVCVCVFVWLVLWYVTIYESERYVWTLDVFCFNQTTNAHFMERVRPLIFIISFQWLRILPSFFFFFSFFTCRSLQRVVEHKRAIIFSVDTIHNVVLNMNTREREKNHRRDLLEKLSKNLKLTFCSAARIRNEKYWWIVGFNMRTELRASYIETLAIYFFFSSTAG